LMSAKINITKQNFLVQKSELQIILQQFLTKNFFCKG
jgi:hypothetical protein